MKKWLFKNQAQEVVSFLPPVQPLLEMAPQFIMARALQVEEPTTAHVLEVGTTQQPLGVALGTTHIHLTRLTRVKGWVESQVFWCNAHNVRVGARMAKLAML